MFKNFFMTAYRNLAKHRLFTILNVFGLALGMSLCLLYIAWLNFVFTFDNFHPLKDRIYRVNTQLLNGQENPLYASAPSGLAQKLQEEIAGVETVVRVNTLLSGTGKFQDKKIGMQGYFTDPSFLKVFNFPLLRGDKNTALNEPNSILISETKAKTIFGDVEGLGQVIRLEPYGDLLVTGI
ncbi:MAG: ABC transporter permease, partial [Flavitalea sp.]